MTVATRHSSLGAAGAAIGWLTSGIPLVALLSPRIAAVMIAELLPKTGLVTVQQLKPAHPLRALPEIEVRHEETRRPTMLRRKRCPIVTEHHPRLAARYVTNGQVRGVSAIAEGDDEPSFRQAGVLRGLQQRIDGDALPPCIELRPLGNAVDVDGRSLMRQLLKFFPRPRHRAASRISNGEMPGCERYAWSWTGGKHRKIPRLILPGRQAVLRCRRTAAMETAGDKRFVGHDDVPSSSIRRILAQTATAMTSQMRERSAKLPRVQRASENPIITPASVRPSRPDLAVVGAFNPGVARHNGEVVLLLRVAE